LKGWDLPAGILRNIVLPFRPEGGIDLRFIR